MKSSSEVSAAQEVPPVRPQKPRYEAYAVHLPPLAAANTVIAQRAGEKNGPTAARTSTNG